MDAELLKAILSYDPETGLFIWKIDPPRGKSHKGCVAGSVAGNGYRQIKISGKVYAQHRLAFLYVYGRVPIDEIDHINGNKQDNRIVNLREASSSLNKQNRHIPSSNNFSGILGASLDKRRGYYVANISVDGKQKYLGSFKTAEDANKAYIDAKRIFHPGCTI